MISNWKVKRKKKQGKCTLNTSGIILHYFTHQTYFFLADIYRVDPVSSCENILIHAIRSTKSVFQFYYL